MLYYLDGLLLLPDPGTAVIDCGGVGYKLNIASSTLQKLAGKEGQRVKLFTHMDVKEGSVDLFGFSTEEELFAFRQLITVSGVGPKAAIAILSVLSPEKLRLAIAGGDVKAITAANGVGKKIADRIILELREKFAASLSPSDVSTGDGGDMLLPATDDAADALNYLMLLGYTRAEATAAIKKAEPAGKTLDDIMRQALRYLAKQ